MNNRAPVVFNSIILFNCISDNSLVTIYSNASESAVTLNTAVPLRNGTVVPETFQVPSRSVLTIIVQDAISGVVLAERRNVHISDDQTFIYFYRKQNSNVTVINSVRPPTPHLASLYAINADFVNVVSSIYVCFNDSATLECVTLNSGQSHALQQSSSTISLQGTSILVYANSSRNTLLYGVELLGDIEPDSGVDSARWMILFSTTYAITSPSIKISKAANRSPLVLNNAAAITLSFFGGSNFLFYVLYILYRKGKDKGTSLSLRAIFVSVNL